MEIKHELPEDLWQPLYDRVNFFQAMYKIWENPIIDQMYERACRRFPGDSCVQDIVFYNRTLFEIGKVDEFGRRIEKRRKKNDSKTFKR